MPSRQGVFSVMLALLIVASLAGVIARAGDALYPCSSCHTQITAKPDRKSSSFHDVDLTKGSHSGLACVNCHNASSAMMQLNGGVNISVLIFNTGAGAMEVGKMCAQCHEAVYEDWLRLAHGNSTFTCPDGAVRTVTGYMGGIYYLHDCPEGSTYDARPALACTGCHDPHDPTFQPPGILPSPGDRPEPSSQDGILYGGIAVTAAGLALIAAAPLIHFKGRR